MKCNTDGRFIEDLERRSEAEPLARSCVKFARDGVAQVLAKAGHALTFRQVLPNQAVGVFVAAALPRVVRGGEVKDGAGMLLDLLVIVELRAIITGDGRKRPGVLIDKMDDAAVERGRGAVRQLADQNEAGLSFDERDDAVFAARPHHGVDLPVADVLPRFDFGGALTDPPLTR